MKAIIVLGEPGTGKTTALRKLDPQTTMLITPNDKDLTWPGWRKQGWPQRTIRLTSAEQITELPKRLRQISEKYPQVKTVIVDDFTHIQTQKIRSQGFLVDGKGGNKYARWDQFSVDLHTSVFSLTGELREDLTVVVINHTETDANGRGIFKTFGKAVGNSTMPTSYASVVLHSLVLADKPVDERYVFLTNDDGVHEAKSPMGMFAELYIPNDLAAVLKRINEYNQDQAAPVSTTPTKP